MTRAAIRPRFRGWSGASGPATRSRSASTSRRGAPDERRRVRAGTRSSRATAPGCVRTGVSWTRRRDGEGRHERGDRAEDEDEADAAEPVGAERADRGTEQQAAHLGRAVQPERLAAALRRRRVGQVAARRGVVDRRAEPGSRRAAARNGRAPVKTRGSAPRTPVTSSPMTISGTRPVRSASQPKIGSRDEPRGRPCRDDQPERREVEALLGEVQRQHREEPAEPEPHDELGHQERQDVAPAVEPGRDPGWRGRVGHRVRGSSGSGEPTRTRPPGALRRAAQDAPYTRPPHVARPIGARRRAPSHDPSDHRGGPGEGLPLPQERGPRPRRRRPRPSRKAPSSACSARTARARRPPSGSSPRCSGPTPAGRPSPGFDVVTRGADEMRRVIGLSGQYARWTRT